jgi:threonine dehydrogenase-like Zn-dependent dehydrogenase
VRAAIFNEPRNVTAGDQADAAIREPSDAVVRVVLACVCGSDLWYYRGDSPFEPGPIGHEFVGDGAVGLSGVLAAERLGERVRFSSKILPA